MKKQYVIKIIVCALLSIVLILGNCVNSFASETTESGDHGGGGVYRGNIYSSNNLNQQVINAWNSLTADERADLVPSLYPMIMNKLGVALGNPALDYEIVSSYWTMNLNIYKNGYPNYEDLYNDLSISREISLLYGNGTRYYDYFYEFLYDHIQLVDNELVTDSPTNNMLVNLTNDYVSENSPVYKECTIPSYRFLPTNLNWNNYGQYQSLQNFIRDCNGWCFVYWNSSSQIRIIVIPYSVEIGLFGSVDTGNFFNDVRYAINWEQTDSPWRIDSRCKNYIMNGQGQITESQNYYACTKLKNNLNISTTSNTWNVYTSLSQNETVFVFPNLSSYRAYSGGENPYKFESYWGSVPSTTISSNDLTNYYQNTYTDSHNIIGSNNTTIYYPDSYNPYDNTYDPENKTLDFSGVGNLLSSIGAFLGSIINGIAQGIANIINSLTSIFQNLSGLMNGSVSGFLGAIFGFLPSEFVTVLLAGISLSILFMILSFIRR